MSWKISVRAVVAAAVSAGWIASTGAAGPPGRPDVPGVVIDHIPASSGIYIGSPSLAVLPGGDYVASHDEFGPKSRERKLAVSHVFRSGDRGRTWKRISTVEGAFWSKLFVHRGALYFIGTDRHYGNAVIRRSDDGGATWTSPTDGRNGLLRDDGEYHCAPMPVIEHGGRLWHGMERRDPPAGWGVNFRAGMFSVPVDADLLDASRWTFSGFLPSDRSWNGGDMGGWLEGNAVVAPDGGLVDVLRVQTRSPDEKAALVRISPDGKSASFDPAEGFVRFPGGAKKFAIRFDPQTKMYWSLATIVHERHRAPNPGGIRNTLALTRSADLREWEVRCILLYHPDVKKHGFQYVDWLFDGEDLIAACRTACDDGQGGAHNNHDANYLTFHRFGNFRRLTPEDSVPMPEKEELKKELGALTLTGSGFEMSRLDNGEKAFSNRDYVWQDVPEPFRGWRLTRTAGGERAEIRVRAGRAATVHVATALSQKGVLLEGWRKTDHMFRYTDRNRTVMTVFTRPMAGGDEAIVPQGNWTGTIVLVPEGGP